MGRRGFVAALLAPFILVPVNIFAQTRRRWPYQKPQVTSWEEHEYWRRQGPVNASWSYQWWHRPKRQPWRRWQRFPPNIERMMEQEHLMRELVRDTRRYPIPHIYPRLQESYKSPARIYWEQLTEKLFR